MAACGVSGDGGDGKQNGACSCPGTTGIVCCCDVWGVSGEMQALCPGGCPFCGHQRQADPLHPISIVMQLADTPERECMGGQAFNWGGGGYSPLAGPPLPPK